MPDDNYRQGNKPGKMMTTPRNLSTASKHELACLYHAHHRQYKADLAFWEQLAREHPGPVLELGCGTGRVTYPMLSSGHKVFGLDYDREMLAILQQQNPAGRSRPVPVFQADMGSYHLALSFALIMIPCNTLSTLTPQNRQRSFTTAFNHLRPGGVLAAGLPNPALLQMTDRTGEAEPETSFLHPLKGEPVQVSSAWNRGENRFSLTWHYDRLHADGTVTRLSVTSHHSLDPLSTYRTQLCQAGFQEITFWGDFQGRAYSEDAPEALFTAHRPG